MMRMRHVESLLNGKGCKCMTYNESGKIDTSKPIAAGCYVECFKGCSELDIRKGNRLYIRSITPLGAEYSHAVRVVIEFKGRVLSMYARHINRLGDVWVILNDGNPCRKIQVVRT